MPLPTKEQYADLRVKRKAAAEAALELLAQMETGNSVAIERAADVYLERQAEYVECKNGAGIKVREFDK